MVKNASTCLIHRSGLPNQGGNLTDIWLMSDCMFSSDTTVVLVEGV